MDWTKIYPSVADVNQASFETLYQWSKNLPIPEKDVERTVIRRISNKLKVLAAKDVREKAPDIAEKWNELEDCIAAKLGIKPTWRM